MAQSKIIAGIDVGSTKIVTIVAQSLKEEGEINVVGASSIPSTGVRKGQIVNIDQVTETLVSSVEAAERMAGYSLSRAFISVGGAHIASQNSHGVVAVAEPEKEITANDVGRVIEAARAISLPSSREILHCLPRAYTVDGQEGIVDPVGMNGIRLEIETHIASASKTAVRNLTKCVNEAGIDIEDLVFSGLSASESVLTETEKELGVVLADIGGGTVSIVVFIEGSPVYSSVLPVGAKNVTNDLAIGLRLSLETAEKLKLVLGQKQKKIAVPLKKGEKEKEEIEKNEDEIDLAKLGIDEETKTVSRKTLTEGIVRPRLNEIFTMVGLEIKKSGFGGMTPSGIVICGGGAQTVGAVEAAKRTLSLPARIGIPSGVSGLVDEILTPAFAVSLGLILYGSKQERKGGFSRLSVPNFGKIARNLPVKGIIGRFVEMAKSFLP